MRLTPFKVALTGALLASAAGLSLAWAEDAPPPPRLVLDLGLRLSHDSNPDLVVSGAKATTTTALTFGLQGAETTQDTAFRYGLSGQLQSGKGVADPGLTLSYKRQGKGSSFSLGLDASDRAVDLSEPLRLADGSLSSAALVATTGRVRSGTARLDLQTGTDQRLGFDLSATASTQDYSQTTDPSVYDTQSESLSATGHLRGLSGGDLALKASASALRAEDVLHTRQTSRGLSLSYSQPLADKTTLTGTIGTTSAETQKAGVVTSSSAGLTGALGLTRALADGSFSLGLQLDRDALGGRQSLTLSRDLVLPTAKLSAELGYSARDGGSGAATGRLSLTTERPSDTLTFALSRQVVLNSDDVDTAQSTVSADWTHKVGAGSSLGLGYALNGVAGLGGSGTGSGAVDGVTRQSLTATWNQDLARDWALQAGLQWQVLDRDSTGRAEDGAIFLTISRKLVLLP